jgi:hypothetical protein
MVKIESHSDALICLIVESVKATELAEMKMLEAFFLKLHAHGVHVT